MTPPSSVLKNTLHKNIEAAENHLKSAKELLGEKEITEALARLAGAIKCHIDIVRFIPTMDKHAATQNLIAMESLTHKLEKLTSGSPHALSAITEAVTSLLTAGNGQNTAFRTALGPDLKADPVENITQTGHTHSALSTAQPVIRKHLDLAEKKISSISYPEIRSTPPLPQPSFVKLVRDNTSQGKASPETSLR